MEFSRHAHLQMTAAVIDFIIIIIVLLFIIYFLYFLSDETNQTTSNDVMSVLFNSESSRALITTSELLQQIAGGHVTLSVIPQAASNKLVRKNHLRILAFLTELIVSDSN